MLAIDEAKEYNGEMSTVSDILRRELAQCGYTRYAVGKATGIPQSVLSRFASGKALHGKNMDTLAEHLGLVLTKKTGKARKDR